MMSTLPANKSDLDVSFLTSDEKLEDNETVIDNNWLHLRVKERFDSQNWLMTYTHLTPPLLADRYYCQVMFQHTGQELADNLKECMSKALRKYHEVNGGLPDRIVVYRDGVGDGQV